MEAAVQMVKGTGQQQQQLQQYCKASALCRLRVAVESGDAPALFLALGAERAPCIELRLCSHPQS